MPFAHLATNGPAHATSISIDSSLSKRTMDSFKDIFDPASAGILLAVLLKLGIGAVLGGAIGYERERSGRPAGLRTHMLLVIGVVLFSEVSKAFSPGDGGRIAAQIVTGVGFLGAGTIMRLGVEIKGLTSAASLWAASAIGMAVSVGGAFILIAVVGTALTLLTLAWVTVLERRLVPHSHESVLQVEMDGRDSLPRLIDVIQYTGAKIKGMRVVSSAPLHVQVDVEGEQVKVMSAVSGTEGVKSSSWID